MFAILLEWLVGIGIIVYAVRRFFVVRQYWLYRHEQAATDGISVIASWLSLATTVPFLIKFIIIDRNLILISKETVDVVMTTMTLLIGSGIWVASSTHRDPWAKMKRAIALERRETLQLPWKSHTSPDIQNIMCHPQLTVAITDDDIYSEFMARWQLSKTYTLGQNYRPLIDYVEIYLQSTPSIEQAAHLKDIISLMRWTGHQNVLPILQSLRDYVEDEYQRLHVVVIDQSDITHTSTVILDGALAIRQNIIIADQYVSQSIAERARHRLAETGLFAIVRQKAWHNETQN
jgi:hypothetical protein